MRWMRLVAGAGWTVLVGCSTLGTPAGRETETGAGESAMPSAASDAEVSAASGVYLDPDIEAAHEFQASIEKNCFKGVPRLPAEAIGAWVPLVREGYVLAYAKKAKVPIWVCEGLRPDHLDGTADLGRSRFKSDPELSPAERAELDDYVGSGMDPGPMAPAADFKYDQKVMDESHCLSNTAPQVGDGFLRGVWARLEEWTRGVVRRRGHAHVVTGPIIAGSEVRTIGPGRVAVPTHFYKIVVSRDGKGCWQAIAFMLQNRSHTPQESEDLSVFVTSIDRIEELTGLDFMPRLSETDEVRMERRPSAMWN